MKASPFDPSEQYRNLDSKILSALERIGHAFRVLLWDESTAASLSPIQVQVLIFMRFHDREYANTSYLAKEFNVSKASMSDTIRSLEEKQLIHKVQDLNDKRRFSLQLSDSGNSISAKLSDFSQGIKRPLNRMSASEKEIMFKGLAMLIRHLHQSGIISVQRMCFSCAHYRTSVKGHQHFCTLLQQGLHDSELRLDCPEHVALERTG